MSTSNANEPAFPHLVDSSQQIGVSEMYPGLTKREFFAAVAMLMFSNSTFMAAMYEDARARNWPVEKSMKAAAYSLADEMLAADPEAKT